MMYSTPSSSQWSRRYWTMAFPSAVSPSAMSCGALPDGWPSGSVALGRVPPRVIASAPGTLEITWFAAACTCGLIAPPEVGVFAGSVPAVPDACGSAADDDDAAADEAAAAAAAASAA